MIHLTLNTGDCRNSPRTEVSDAVITALAPMIRDQSGPVPGMAPWRVVISRAPGGAVFDVRRGHESAVICGLAWTDEGADEVWESLEKLYLSTSDSMAQIMPMPLPDSVMQLPDMPATLPWLAALILPSGMMATARTDMSWIGDFERCLAWAILDSEQ